MNLNQEQVEAWLAEWQERLGLRDWDARVEIRRVRDMDVESAVASVWWCEKKRSAVIKLLDPVDHPGADDLVCPIDPEREVIHELLHLHFVPFQWQEGDERTEIAQEQAIHAISKALIALKRSLSPPTSVAVVSDRFPTSIHAIATANANGR